MIDKLKTKKNIDGKFYASELKQLKVAIKLKQRGKLRASVLLVQGYAPIHTAQVALAEAANFKLPHHTLLITGFSSLWLFVSWL